MHMTRHWSRTALLAFLLTLAVALYANCLLNGFVFDDNTLIFGNPYLHNFDHIREILTGPVLTSAGPQRILNYYRPLVMVTFLLSYQNFGPVAFGFHLVNLAIHAAIVALLFFITERMFRDRNLAFVAAGLFAINPIHIESVVWISGLTDLEVTLFLLLAFWFYCSPARPAGASSTLTQLAGLGSFSLALLSKEPAMLFPALATIYEHFYREDRGQTSWDQKVRRYGPFWLIVPAYLLLRIRFLGAFAPVTYRPQLNPAETLLSGLALFAEYFQKILWPVRLSVYYTFRDASSVLDPRVLAGTAALLCCLTVFLALWKRGGMASFGVIWFLVTLLPVLNSRWMTGSAFGDRYLYLPSVGFCWIGAWVWMGLWERPSNSRRIWRQAMASALAIVTAGCAWRIVTRNRDWRTDITLYSSALDVSPDALLVRNLLGLAHWDRGDLQAAEDQWQEVLRRGPANAWTLDYLGLLRLRQRRYPEAKEYIQRSLAIHPDYATGHAHLAEVCLATGESREAEQHLLIAVALSPEDSKAHNQLGKFYEDAGKLPEAEGQFRLAMENSPDSETCTGLGDIYLRRGAVGQAEALFKQALTLEHSNSRAHFGLGSVYSTQSRYAEAIREYEAGLQTDPSNSEARAELDRLKAPTHPAAPSNH
jgi:tetratricopeptide (TPR) repeat protein